MNMRGKIAGIIWHDRQGQNTPESVADAILATIKASVPELVWRGEEDDCYVVCDMGSTGYEVRVTDTLERSCDYVWQARFLERGQSDVGLGGGTYEQAKAAAQAHYAKQLTGWMDK